LSSIFAFRISSLEDLSMSRRIWPVFASLVTAIAFSGVVNAQSTGASKPAAKAPRPSVEKADKITLKVGDAAPELKVQKWVKGTPVEAFEAGKGYVVEFWATWCPPCRESIPKLTKLAKTYKNVRFIAIAASEREDTAQLGREVVEGFVKRQGKAMGYTVGYTSDRLVNKHWMGAAGAPGIPSAFVIDAAGKITWIGNPLEDAFDNAVATLSENLASSKPQNDKSDADDGGSQPPRAAAPGKPSSTSESKPEAKPATTPAPTPAPAPDQAKPKDAAPASDGKPPAPHH